MARFNGIKCDQCEAIGELRASLEPPIGWIEIKMSGVSGASQVVCGINCAQRWVTNRKKEAKHITKTKDEQAVRFHEANCGDGEHEQHHPQCPLAPVWS